MRPFVVTGHNLRMAPYSPTTLVLGQKSYLQMRLLETFVLTAHRTMDCKDSIIYIALSHLG